MGLKIFDGVEVPERNDAEYEAYFRSSDIAQSTIVPSAVLSLTGTLVDLQSATIIRNAQNMLNANNGVMEATGRFVLGLLPADHLIYGTAPNTLYRRRLTLRVSYSKTGGVVGEVNHEIIYYVRSMADVV